MSSLFAHAADGMALAGRGGKPWGWRIAMAAAALAPDIDYPLQWIGGIRFPIRYTHSLGFCLAVALASAAALRSRRDPEWLRGAALITVAVFSHLMLDALVGVYPEPWFWPFSEVTFRLPFGILPSAGRMAWDNPFLYRNLAIEAGILGPLIWMGMPGRTASPAAKAFAFLVFLAAVSIGAGLDRTCGRPPQGQSGSTAAIGESSP